jgi:hypothetical protein
MRDKDGFEIVNGFYLGVLGMIYYHVKEDSKVFFIRSLRADYSRLEQSLADTLIHLSCPERLGQLIKSVTDEEKNKI